MGTWPVDNTAFLVVVIEPKWCMLCVCVWGGLLTYTWEPENSLIPIENLSSHPHPHRLLFSGVWSRLEMTRWMRYFSDFMSFAC